MSRDIEYTKYIRYTKYTNIPNKSYSIHFVFVFELLFCFGFWWYVWDCWDLFPSGGKYRKTCFVCYLLLCFWECVLCFVQDLLRCITPPLPPIPIPCVSQSSFRGNNIENMFNNIVVGDFYEKWKTILNRLYFPVYIFRLYWFSFLLVCLNRFHLYLVVFSVCAFSLIFSSDTFPRRFRFSETA